MPIDRDKRYLILGVGITGASVARFLHAQGAEFRVADSRENHSSVAGIRDNFPALDLALGEFESSLLQGVDALVINPGLSRKLPVVQEALALGIDVIGDIELFAQTIDCPVVAVTGTNGKSTVVSMLQSMADFSDKKALCGGNIGEPALDLIGQGAEIVILELSSYQLESTRSLKPAVACVLNVSEDHMDRYDSLAHYALVKQNVYRGAARGVCLLGDERSEPASNSLETTIVSNRDPEFDQYGVRNQWLCHGELQLFDLKLLGAPGRHNELNACFAWAMGEVLGFSAEAMRAGLQEFKGLPHRTELVAEIAGVRYFNDSKGTNVGATLVALQSMPCKVVLLAGGDGKSQDFSPLLPALQSSARAVVTYGADGDKVADVARDSVPVFSADSLESAVAIAREQAEQGDCVLLSPACASFDMFKSYQDRGHAFVACVERMRA